MVPAVLLGETVGVFSKKKCENWEKGMENAQKLLLYLGVEAWGTAVKRFLERVTLVLELAFANCFAGEETRKR